MKILFVLTYYRPHVSGLTIYVDRLARAMAKRGHVVTVLTSRYDRSLAKVDTVEGVHIVRVPVLMRVSKGVIMPTLGLEAWKHVREHDVISLHLPQLDAAGIALRGRLLRKPTILTYHCDLRLPDGTFNRFVNLVVHIANRAAGALADRVVAYTKDYAEHSPFISTFMDKVAVIPPPVEVENIPENEYRQFRNSVRPDEGPVVGMAARLATEKGVEYLLQALEKIRSVYPGTRALFAGQYRDVMGEEEYARKLQPMIENLGESWQFLGVLDSKKMTAFYRSCDVTVLPSVNSTESFGLVQIESMICGTPVVASDLPGVRQPVYQTGMGEVVPVRDAEKLAKGILSVLADREAYQRDSSAVQEMFSSAACAERYELLLEGLMKEKRGSA